MREQFRTHRGMSLFLIAFSALVVTVHFDLLSHVAYAFERGRLQADLEHLEGIDSPEIAALETISHAYGIIAEVVKPSVVYIESISNNVAFNRELQKMFGEENFQPRPSTGTGSGIIIDRDGYIVTNNHVVEDSETVRVILADGRRFRAQIIGTDPMTDLAVIKIDADRLHPARLGNSEAMKVGHIVLAIGSPFRLGHSVSHGIISAIGRSNVDVDIDYQNWLQTDTPINPGNSGGPLINTRGEIIGINTAIATESGGNQGVAFAIPSNTIARIAAKLKSGSRIVRGYLGVQIEPVDPRIASAYGLEEAGGVLIRGVVEDAPAAQAGLKRNDIIRAINGRMLRSNEDLTHAIAATDPNTDVDLTVWREKQEIQLTVTVAAQPSGFSTRGSIRELNRRGRSKGDERTRHNRERGSRKSEEAADRSQFQEWGFSATTVSPKLARHFKLDEDVETGALITRIDPVGDAYDARLRQGDVVVRANGRRIRTARELKQALTQEAIRKGVRLRVRRGADDFDTVLQVR